MEEKAQLDQELKQAFDKIDMDKLKSRVKEQVRQEILADAQVQVILDLKKKVEAVMGFIRQLEKSQDSNKKSKTALKTMQKFLNCHVSNPAILKRYQEVMILMEKYANGVKA